MQNQFINQKEILGDLITDLCLSGKTSLDEQKINQIKKLCKYVSLILNSINYFTLLKF